jgi:hypothetical protein
MVDEEEVDGCCFDGEKDCEYNYSKHMDIENDE